MDLAATDIARKRDTSAIAADNELYCWLSLQSCQKEEVARSPAVQLSVCG
jgi:hypothetical protein